MNTPTTKITRCALALDINTALEIEMKNPDVAMDFMQTARNDPRFMDFMKMLHRYHQDVVNVFFLS
jgi:hypothetical protein